MNLLPLTYLGNVQYFTKLCLSPCVIDLHEHFVKQSYRNRCDILATGGPLALTVQTVHVSGRGCPMRDVRIDYSKRWQHQHWYSIRSAYKSSPYFDYRLQPRFASSSVAAGGRGGRSADDGPLSRSGRGGGGGICRLPVVAFTQTSPLATRPRVRPGPLLSGFFGTDAFRSESVDDRSALLRGSGGDGYPAPFLPAVRGQPSSCPSDLFGKRTRLPGLFSRNRLLDDAGRFAVEDDDFDPVIDISAAGLDRVRPFMKHYFVPQEGAVGAGS